jgi:hypothetical protein
MFQPAVKEQLKARVAFDGPTGSGKTWTALKWATVLAGDDGKIAFIDTERDSAKLYANHFTFDVARFEPPYEVPRLIETLRNAETAGYAVVVVDSLSHFWEGEGGLLDEVDAAAARSFGGSTFAGWKHGTPLQRHMVDTFLSLDCHVIVCMRSKMEYVLVEYTDSKGQKKTKPEKVGMAPVQRSGLEYEFTIVGDLDLEHRITFSKSRCDVLADKMIQPHRESEAAETFLAWLNDGTPPPPPADAIASAAFAAKVKEQSGAIRHAMNAWWKERGLVTEKLTAPQLDEAYAHLADLLLTAPSANGSGEPDGNGSGESTRPVGDDRTATEDQEPSGDTAVAASPDAESGEGESLPPSSSSPDAIDPKKQPCARCGSKQAPRIVIADTVVCEIVPACRARAEQKAESAA